MHLPRYQILRRELCQSEINEHDPGCPELSTAWQWKLLLSCDCRNTVAQTSSAATGDCNRKVPMSSFTKKNSTFWVADQRQCAISDDDSIFQNLRITGIIYVFEMEGGKILLETKRAETANVKLTEISSSPWKCSCSTYLEEGMAVQIVNGKYPFLSCFSDAAGCCQQ